MNTLYENFKLKFNNTQNIFIYDNEKYNFYNLIKEIYNNEFNINIDLENIHELLNSNLIDNNSKEYYSKIPIFGKNDRESIFVKIFYKYFDLNNNIKKFYEDFIINYIKPTYFNSEEYLVVQKTPNIRFHLPNCSNIGSRNSDPNKNIIGLHNDYEFNHDENEINLIIPITNMFDTNSIYFESYENSNYLYENYNNLKLNKNNLAFMYFNKWNHYNMINTTNQTRVSFDIRIIPYSKYTENIKKSETHKNKLIIGDYFIKI